MGVVACLTEKLFLFLFYCLARYLKYIKPNLIFKQNMNMIYKVFVPTTKAVVSEHTDIKEANKACVEFNKKNGGIALVIGVKF